MPLGACGFDSRIENNSTNIFHRLIKQAIYFIDVYYHSNFTMKCLVCGINEANQTGAHIFPAWMIASAFDINNRTRGHEIIYALQPFDSKLPYFGNSVLPDKIIDQIGRDLTDSEINYQKNHLTVDNLWCQTCERKFSIVEEYFLENVERELTDFTNCNNTSIYELSHANNYIIRLFFYSLFLRAHFSGFMGFKLNFRAFRKLKYFINHYIQDSLASTKDFIDSSYRKDQLLKYPIRCLKSEQKIASEGWVYLHERHARPYCFIINKYFIQFYGKGDQTKFKPEDFFSISSIITEMDDIKNYKENVFKIGLLNYKLYTIVKKHYIDYVTDIRMNNYILMFRLLFKSKFKHTPTRAMTSIFLKELLENDLPLGIKYTKEMIVEALNRTIAKIDEP